MPEGELTIKTTGMRPWDAEFSVGGQPLRYVRRAIIRMGEKDLTQVDLEIIVGDISAEGIKDVRLLLSVLDKARAIEQLKALLANLEKEP